MSMDRKEVIVIDDDLSEEDVGTGRTTNATKESSSSPAIARPQSTHSHAVSATTDNTSAAESSTSVNTQNQSSNEPQPKQLSETQAQETRRPSVEQSRSRLAALPTSRYSRPSVEESRARLAALPNSSYRKRLSSSGHSHDSHASMHTRSPYFSRRPYNFDKGRRARGLNGSKDQSFREAYVKRGEDKKISKAIAQGSARRVTERHVIELDDLDPELLTGQPLTPNQAAWVRKKQIRREWGKGPNPRRSVLWPAGYNPNEKEKKIDYIETEPFVMDLNAERCTECMCYLWGNPLVMPLSAKAERIPEKAGLVLKTPLCEGCSRLFSFANSQTEKMDLIHWILFGEPRTAPLPPLPPYHDIKRILTIRRRSMVTRSALHFNTVPKDLATVEEMFEKFKSTGFRCAATGSRLHFDGPRLPSYAFLTIDHIRPLSLAADKPGCWSIKNFQPMSKCMNSVKGNETSREFLRWLNLFNLRYITPELNPGYEAYLSD